MRQGRVRASDIDFAYLEDGPPGGPLALCLHGFPDHAPTFRGLLGELADAGFHAVAPWMRGYHPSGAPGDGRYQVGALSQDALALADALADGGDAVLVAHDWGATCAYGAVAHRPERFSRLVAMAVPHRSVISRGFLSPRQLKRSWYMFFFQMPVADRAAAADDYALIDALWADWSPGYRPPPEDMAALKATFAEDGCLHAALGYYRHLWDTAHHDPALRQLQAASALPVPVPTLYLHGSDDGCVGAELVDSAAMAPAFPAGIEVEVVDGAGHFLHLERPGVVNRRIVEFLTR